MDESRKLAQFLAGLIVDDLPRETVERAKDVVLDQLGVELAVSTTPWSKAVYKYVRTMGGAGESTIVNYGGKVGAENAAFANASFGHGFELDDAYLPGNCHPGCMVVPSALAVGERELVDGKRFILAVVAGYEALGRVARCVAPSCANRGFHSAATAGPFGSAAAAGKLFGFGPTEMLNALSIAGSHASGLQEYTQTGGSVKRLHAGIAAAGGIRAALLAQAGLTGPPTVLEGKKGFCHSFSDKYKLDELVPRHGDGFAIDRMGYKRYSCCYQIQAPIEATAKIVRDHSIKVRDVDEIIMGTNSHGLDVVGTILEPVDIPEAQFSARFSLALCVVKGSNGFRDYTEENLKDPDIKKLARRVRLEVDREVEAMYPAKRAIKMTVKLKDGTSYQQKLDGARGTPENPMTHNEIEDKFRSLASVLLRATQVEELIRVIENLDDLNNLSTLTRLLVS